MRMMMMKKRTTMVKVTVMTIRVMEGGLMGGEGGNYVTNFS